jgi:hypothetical protein
VRAVAGSRTLSPRSSAESSAPRRRTREARGPLRARSLPPRAALARAPARRLPFAAAAPASANQATKILEACAYGTMPTGYSQQAYNQALREMEPELAEYTDCPDLIHKAQLASTAGSRGGSGGPSGGSGEGGAGAAVAPPTADEQRTLEGAGRTSSPPVQLDGALIRPGVVHADIASAVNTLPAPLFALLAFLLASLLLLLARAARDRVRGRSARPRDGRPGGGE